MAVPREDSERITAIIRKLIDTYDRFKEREAYKILKQIEEVQALIDNPQDYAYALEIITNWGDWPVGNLVSMQGTLDALKTFIETSFIL